METVGCHCSLVHPRYDHTLSNGGKPWKYVLIPHNVIAGNMTLAGLSTQFAAN